ncbi:TlpA family protein disulfide reductase [Pedobacter sp. N36a]|uniref:TlpA family protein disulfide reductase n=1 Tax=Pedobacter sp. N36a TaxID=2767996 RepID=UPI00165690D8|nr:TlpA disulfide reductase family protein [Pedobacter sp. N36a]MBC8986632.1 TlpA family protein disulfide reductase [Pedobacter sp. N36a]
MKSFCLMLLCFVLLYIPSYGQYHYTIKAKTSTLNGTKVYFYLMDNKNRGVLKRDSAIFKDQQLEFRGEARQISNFAGITIKDKRTGPSKTFVLDSGQNMMNIEVNPDHVKELDLGLSSKSNEMEANMAQMFRRSFDEAINITGKREDVTPETQLKIHMKVNRILESYPNEYFSLLALYYNSFYGRSIDYSNHILSVLRTFNADLQQSALGKQIYNEQTTLVNNLTAAKAGHSVYKFSVKDADGKVFQNSSLLGQNYLIVFSATWCAPCQLQLPKLKYLYNTYKNKGLKVVYFNVDDDVLRWRKHISSNKLTWINVSERLKPGKSKITKAFGVGAYPTSLLIDKTGKIIYNSDETDPGMGELEAKIKEL